MNNANIKAKYFHSLKTMELSREIATNLGIFNEEEIVDYTTIEQNDNKENIPQDALRDATMTLQRRFAPRITRQAQKLMEKMGLQPIVSRETGFLERVS